MHGPSISNHRMSHAHPLPCLQGFRNKEEVQRFADMMEELCWVVATKHSGSLKGEHGTGEAATVCITSVLYKVGSRP